MKLPLVYDALCELPHSESSDGVNISIRCPFCGDSVSNESGKHFTIKIDVTNGEPLVYHCWLAKCGVKGILKTSDLQLLGITNLDVISELSGYNRGINKNMDRMFIPRVPKKYEPVNLANDYNKQKLAYINMRLGLKLTYPELRNYKIQLSLYDLLDINNIHKLAFGKYKCDLLDTCCIGFISIYSDYMICRDITPELLTGGRYTNYRISGKINPEDMKLYSIPREIDLLNPKAAVINVAEGPFSILGAYLNTELGEERPNSVWIANCGSDYINSIMHICKQYGLLKVRINIWSDSEIKIGKYEKLLRAIENRLDIRKFTVLYNRAAEDFGYSKKDIKIETVTLKEKG